MATLNSSCSIFASDEKCDAVVWVTRCIAMVSFLGCSFVISAVCLFQRYRAFPQRLILCLAISALLETIIYMVGDIPSDAGCKIVGFLNNFASWAVLLWVGAIVINLLVIILSNLEHPHHTRREWLYYVVCWGFSFIYSLLPFFANKYGDSGPFCWIVDDLGWRLAMWYAPLFVIVPTMIAIYITIIVKIRALRRTWRGIHGPEVDSRKETLDKDIIPILIYPFIFFALYIFPIAYRASTAIDHSNPHFELALLTAIFAPMQGSLNALAFICDRDVRAKMNKNDIIKAYGNLCETTEIKDVEPLPMEAEQNEHNEQIHTQGKIDDGDDNFTSMSSDEGLGDSLRMSERETYPRASSAHQPSNHDRVPEQRARPPSTRSGLVNSAYEVDEETDMDMAIQDEEHDNPTLSDDDFVDIDISEYRTLHVNT